MDMRPEFVRSMGGWVWIGEGFLTMAVVGVATGWSKGMVLNDDWGGVGPSL